MAPSRLCISSARATGASAVRVGQDARSSSAAFSDVCSPYAEERFLKEAHRLYGVLESRLAQGMGSDAAAPGLILLCTARRQSRELRAMRITWVMACEEDDQDEAEGATPGFSA